MKYAKPNEAIEGLRFHCRNDSPTSQGLALLKWIDSLPAEFEIVEPGNVQVRWPDGVTREQLSILAEWAKDESIRALAAIAPVEKKKRTISVWESGGHLIAVRDNPNLDSQVVVGWRKVGECEVDA